ncbi:1-deoxy-D-xylulose-5-phosphate synthase N-terminal domain-containing protein [Streptomyces sp. LZ34]
MPRLEEIRGPEDLRALSPQVARELAPQIRRLLVDTCTANGCHLGPNLGVVELSIALHRVFDSPRDKILWDTGHQAYVHRILTGRTEALATLRRTGGMSGYPCRAESEHDVIENSHASPSLSWADGLARANALLGQSDRAVVAVLGAGLQRFWHHARWCADQMGLALADVIVARLLPAGAPITFGAAWHHDGAAKGPGPIGYGKCWVIAGLVVQLPFSLRPVCLPALARLWQPRHTGKLAHAREMAEMIAARYPGRMVHTRT